jgi:hypothetical protein
VTDEVGESSAVKPSAVKPTGEAAGGKMAAVEDDLHPARFPELAWGEADLATSLEAVYHWVEGEGIRAAAWYLQEKKPKARWSRLLRIVAILFATAGAALPFVAANTGRIGFEWGYVMLACAAGAVAMDRFFGFSTAWMRYMTAELAIQQRLRDLQFEWTRLLLDRGTRTVGAHDASTVLEMLAVAAADIQGEIRRETAAWADEFQSNIGELRSLAGPGREG